MIDCRKYKYLQKDYIEYHLSNGDYEEYCDEYCTMKPINFAYESYKRNCEYYESRGKKEGNFL